MAKKFMVKLKYGVGVLEKELHSLDTQLLQKQDDLITESLTEDPHSIIEPLLAKLSNEISDIQEKRYQLMCSIGVLTTKQK